MGLSTLDLGVQGVATAEFSGSLEHDSTFVNLDPNPMGSALSGSKYSVLLKTGTETTHS